MAAAILLEALAINSATQKDANAQMFKIRPMSEQNPQAQNDQEYTEFKQNFQEIKSELLFDNDPIPAEDLQNLTSAQSEQIIAKTD